MGTLHVSEPTRWGCRSRILLTLSVAHRTPSRRAPQRGRGCGTLDVLVSALDDAKDEALEIEADVFGALGHPGEDAAHATVRGSRSAKRLIVVASDGEGDRMGGSRSCRRRRRRWGRRLGGARGGAVAALDFVAEQNE